MESRYNNKTNLLKLYLKNKNQLHYLEYRRLNKNQIKRTRKVKVRKKKQNKFKNNHQKKVQKKQNL